MIENNEIEQRQYSFNWLELGVKVIIFAIILIMIVWVISLFNNQSKNLTNDYYVVSYFTNSQYQTGLKNNNYQYKYTIKILDITPDNSKDVSIVSSNYFHSEEEYENYLEEKNTKMNIINQSNSSISVDNVTNLMNSSLKTTNFTFKVSDIYVFENNYYIDVTLNIKNYTNVKAYSDMYFVPIHLNLKYTKN